MDGTTLHGHFEHVYSLRVSKNDDEKRCFLKYFGFRIVKEGVSKRIPVVCSVSEVGDRTGESVLLSPAPTAVVGGLVTSSSPSNFRKWISIL